MVMRILDIVVAADTTEQGNRFFRAVVDALAIQQTLTLSFDGISTMTSSFANVGVVPLLDLFSFDEIKQRLRVTHSTRQINDMIKSRLEHEALCAA